MRMRHRLTVCVVGVVAIGASALALHPGGAREEQRPTPVFSGAEIDRETLGIFERSCQDCHSDRTNWPWYSRIPPGVWIIRRDVTEARAHLNLSRWQDYSAVEQRARLSQIGAVARTGMMPPARYTFLHRASKLSPAERDRVYRWTRAERSRIAAARVAEPNSP